VNHEDVFVRESNLALSPARDSDESPTKEDKATQSSISADYPLIKYYQPPPVPVDHPKPKASSRFPSIRPAKSFTNFRLHSLLPRHDANQKAKVRCQTTKIPVPSQPFRAQESPLAHKTNRKTPAVKVRLELSLLAFTDKRRTLLLLDNPGFLADHSLVVSLTAPSLDTTRKRFSHCSHLPIDQR
jgi:hypothetical protein